MDDDEDEPIRDRDLLIPYQINPSIARGSRPSNISNNRRLGRPMLVMSALGIATAVLILTAYYYWTLSNHLRHLTLSTQTYQRNISKYQMFRAKLNLKPYRHDSYSVTNLSFDRLQSHPDDVFNMDSNDVLVFVHIQKTAGTTLEKYLVRHLDIDHPCKCSKNRKKCTCLRGPDDPSNWLFSRYSTGWSCGLHADWTELVVQNCVDNVLDRKDGSIKRRYFFFTMLREPIARTLSEFRHVQRGATWKQSRHICNGRPPTPQELPMCFDPDVGWSNVTLDEFTACPFNMATNRQTRMLADLTLINCYNTSTMREEERDRIMLDSAKRNLESMAFFGLQERMDDSQFMFELIFRLNFNRGMNNWYKSKSNDTVCTPEQREALIKMNHLDVQLYRFAVDLFDKRMARLKAGQD